MKGLLSVIVPVLEGMENSHLRNELLQHFPSQGNAFGTIESSFEALTSRKQDAETLRHFFHSWSQTNNSAMTVAGLSNRLTMLIHKNQPVADPAALFRSVASLNRIVDEDLAVVGRVLHSQLFYTMATTISGDDAWLSRRYLHPDAAGFKSWKDVNSLHEKDIMTGLLTTLVHEIYTHGEVEYILPLFIRWLREDYGYEPQDCRRTLAWINVHCGPTEKNHFFYAVSSIYHYCDAMQVRPEDYNLEEIVSGYLRRKSAVMDAVAQRTVVPADLP